MSTRATLNFLALIGLAFLSRVAATSAVERSRCARGTGMRQSCPNRWNLCRSILAPAHQPIVASMLVVFTACGDVTGGESISGAEVDHGKAGAHAGASERAAGMGGRGGQAGKAAAASAGSSGHGGSTANSASTSTGSNAVTRPNEQVLQPGCKFAASDWRTQDGEQLLVACKNDLSSSFRTGAVSSPSTMTTAT